jgi:hypothetical protein
MYFFYLIAEVKVWFAEDYQDRLMKWGNRLLFDVGYGQILSWICNGNNVSCVLIVVVVI